MLHPNGQTPSLSLQVVTGVWLHVAVQELGLRQLSVVPLTLSSQSDAALQAAFLQTPEQEISPEEHCGAYVQVCVKTGVPVQFETEFV
jgi:hypothetical protein